jgi:hypothetical protein
MEALESIRCDLAEYNITVQFHGRKSPLVVHFDTPSRRFYFSMIVLIIIEIKKQGRPDFVYIRRLQDILTRLDDALSGSHASRQVDGMWAKIKMAWRHRLPDLESAALFKVLERDLIPPHEKGGKYRYQCSEAECDAWAGLFGYDENNTWRFKLGSDSTAVGLNDICVTMGDLRDNAAWEAFIDRLGIHTKAEPISVKPGGTSAVDVATKDDARRESARKVVWISAAVLAAAIIAAVVWRLTLYTPNRRLKASICVFRFTRPSTSRRWRFCRLKT